MPAAEFAALEAPNDLFKAAGDRAALETSDIFVGCGVLDLVALPPLVVVGMLPNTPPAALARIDLELLLLAVPVPDPPLVELVVCSPSGRLLSAAPTDDLVPPRWMLLLRPRAVPRLGRMATMKRLG